MFNKGANQTESYQDLMKMGLAKEQSTEQVKYVLNTDDVLTSVEAYLSSLVYDTKRKQWVRDEIEAGKPLMNERGVNEIMRVLKIRLSRIFTLSNFNEKDINIISKQFGRNLVLLFFAKYREYEIERVRIRFITHEIVDCVYATLMKARDGQLQTFLKDTTRVTETITNQSGGRSLNPMRS